MWICHDCGALAIAPDLMVCPQCGKEREMPKITSGGTTNADAPDSGPVPAPAKSAPKADWVDHAVAQGVPRERAEEMSKAELIEHHGDAAPAQPHQDADEAPAEPTPDDEPEEDDGTSYAPLVP